MPTVIGTLPTILENGTPQDATQVMQIVNFLRDQVNANAALLASSFSFAGNGDPSTIPGNAIQPYMLWADTSVTPPMLRRRNAANTAWVPVAKLLLNNSVSANVDVTPVGDVTATDVQAAIAALDARITANATAVTALANPDLIGTPIGGYITPFSPPPTNDPRFRYIVCTAGQSGAGGYNNDVLTSETVTGSDPTITATAVVNLAGSPMNGITVPLVNTSRAFFRPGTAAGAIVNSQNLSHAHSYLQQGGSAGIASGNYLTINWTNNGSTTGISGGSEAAPRYMPFVYYQRIL